MAARRRTASSGEARQFSRVAAIYDALMAGIAYDIWVRYIHTLWSSRGLDPRTVLDIACGTGNVSFRLAEEGLRVAGVDNSQEMIAVAESKLSRSQRLEGNPAFYCQDAAELDLPFTFDSALCLFDSFNYILDYERLCSAFRRTLLHLRPGGIFIFDVNTVYALSHGFFDQDDLSSDSYPRYVWRSSWDPASRLCTVEMDFEALTDSGVETFREVHTQRGYTQEELTRGLESAGFSDISVFHAYTMRPPNRRSDRLYFVAQRPPD